MNYALRTTFCSKQMNFGRYPPHHYIFIIIFQLSCFIYISKSLVDILASLPGRKTDFQSISLPGKTNRPKIELTVLRY